jgi:hypothetical protein
MGKMKYKKRVTSKFFFSVEGETEELYFQHLSKLINNDPKLKQVKFVISNITNRKPITFASQQNSFTDIILNHIIDFEDFDHLDSFKEILNELSFIKKSNKYPGIKNYKLGYSNCSFELWVILHKHDCNTTFLNRTDYLKPINDAYKTSFESLSKYKSESNFVNIILKSITLKEISDAILRAENIMKNCVEVHKKSQNYRRYVFYTESPSLSIHEIIKEVLLEVGYIF